VAPLVKEANDRLRERLQQLADALSKTQKAAASSLDQDESWSKLDEAQRASVQEEAQLGSIPDLKVGTVDEVLATLRVTPEHPGNPEGCTASTLCCRTPQGRPDAHSAVAPLTCHTDPEDGSRSGGLGEVREDLLTQVKNVIV
jgi:hypothetical protein